MSDQQEPRAEAVQLSFTAFDPLADRQASEREGQLTVHNILKSYHSNYDLFAEAIQNAMDAVHLRWREEAGFKPVIHIEIDETADTFTVIDNGVGITQNMCASVFAPNFSLKSQTLLSGGRRLRGHKGVGATFLAYGFNRTDLSSKVGTGEIWSGRILGARRWATGQEGAARPLVNPYVEDSPVFRTISKGTLMRVQCESGTRPASLARIGGSIEAWKAILRTESAIGMLPVGVEEGFRPTVTLHYKTSTGNLEEIVEPTYLFPHLVFEERRTIDLQAYHDNNQRATPPSSALNKEGIYRSWSHEQLLSAIPDLLKDVDELESRAPLEIWAYGFMAYGTKFFDDAKKHLGGSSASRQWVRAGLRLAAESMVIGGERPIGLKRYTFSANSSQIVVHIAGIEPDIGRKGFEQSIEDLAQKIAKWIIEDYLVGNREFLRAESGPKSEAKLETWKFEARSREIHLPLPRIKGVHLRLTSIPLKEQDVVALFNQLLGAGAIPGYELVSSSTHQQYDCLCWVRLSQPEVDKVEFDLGTRGWGIERFRADGLLEKSGNARIVSLEFKADLFSLVAEFRSEKKKFHDIELAVAWDAGSGFGRVEDFELRKIEIPDDVAERIYPGQTHELRSGGNADHVIRVILLDELMKQLRGE